MIDLQVTRQLRRQGYDILSCQEAGLSNRGISDDAQLAFAAQEGRALLTFNVQDFAPLDRRWTAAGQSHAGIIAAAASLPLGYLIRCVARHLDTVPPDVQYDTLLWLDTSPIA